MGGGSLKSSIGGQVSTIQETLRKHLEILIDLVDKGGGGQNLDPDVLRGKRDNSRSHCPRSLGLIL